MEFDEHGDGEEEDEDVDEGVDDGVGEVDVVEVEAVAFAEGLPEFLDGTAGEEEDEHEGDGVADCDGHDGEDAVSEGFGRVEAEVEEEDGDFGEGDGGNVDDCAEGELLRDFWLVWSFVYGNMRDSGLTFENWV